MLKTGTTVLIYTAESTGALVKGTKTPNLQNSSKGYSNPGSLDCESGILPLSYHVPYKITKMVS